MEEKELPEELSNTSGVNEINEVPSTEEYSNNDSDIANTQIYATQLQTYYSSYYANFYTKKLQHEQKIMEKNVQTQYLNAYDNTLVKPDTEKKEEDNNEKDFIKLEEEKNSLLQKAIDKIEEDCKHLPSPTLQYYKQLHTYYNNFYEKYYSAHFRAQCKIYLDYLSYHYTAGQITATPQDQSTTATDYTSRANFNKMKGRFQTQTSEEHWTASNLPTDREGRQIAAFFDFEDYQNKQRELKEKQKNKPPKQPKNAAKYWKKKKEEKKRKRLIREMKEIDSI